MSAARHKSLAVRIKSAGDPSADQLTRIHNLTLAEFPADQLYVRTFALAHNAIDRDDEVFDGLALADFARTLPGKGLFIKHPSGWDGDSGPGKGRWFEAEIQRMSLDEARVLLRAPALLWPPGVNTAEILMAGAYLVRTESNKDLLTEIDAGIVSDISIGFSAKSAGAITDEAGRELQVRRLTAPAEALEGSLVWLGAQPGARAIKSATKLQEDSEMPTQEQLDQAVTKAAGLETQLAAAQPSHDIVTKARTALGEHAHLLDKPELLGEAAKAAASYRASLIDDVIAGERAAGMCGDTEEEVTTAKSFYAGSSIDALEGRAKAARERTGRGGKVTPSNPNATPPKSEEGDKSAPAIFAGATLL